jgi:enterochelin esterase-like enzyme
VIEYGAELAAGLRTPEVFRSLCDHSGLTTAQLDHVAQTEGIPTAIRYAVWKGQQRKRGRRMVGARRRLVGYYESTP